MLDELKLIEIVEKNPHLYNKGRRDFKDLRKREKTWADIGVLLNLSSEDCQRVWKSLRDKYSRERRNGKSLPDEPSSSWSLFPMLGFLDEHIKCRRRARNAASNGSRRSTSQFLKLENESSRSESFASEDVLFTEYDDDLPEPDIPNASASDGGEGQPTYPPSLRPKTDPLADELSSVSACLTSVLEKKSNEEKHSRFGMFCQYLVDKVPRSKRKTAEKFVINYLYDMAEGDEDREED